MPENTGSASPNAASEGAADFKAPTISLPQGGGAIRGIDEKFAANPVTGAGSLDCSHRDQQRKVGFRSSAQSFLRFERQQRTLRFRLELVPALDHAENR